MLSDSMTETKSYIALEYVDGISFERLIAEHGALPWRWAAEAVLQVLSALNAIHEKNIIHRDIKPANCLNAGRHKPLSQPPRTKLVDFGIATLTDSIGSATPTGTPAYSSPEQASGRKIDCRSDIYSVGATFYELMCGRPPNRSTYRPPSSENTAAGIPPEIDQVIHKALAGDPAERHESAVAFADDLRFAISANAVPGTLVSPTWFEPPVGAIAGEPLAMHQNEQLLRLRRRVEVFWVAGVLGPVVDWMALARQRRTLELDWVAGLGAELQGGQPVEIAPECSLEDLYKAQGRTLLILGGPGSGKTTQLLLLARHLLREGEPAVATIFTLSGWARRRSSLDDWMGEELHTKYQVPRTLAGIWIASHQIIPLLDGLDDIAVADRGACIRAINEFAARAGPDMPGLIVTSRLDEYSAVADRLSLGAAVCLHSLDQSSIVEYLGRYAEGGEKQRRLLQSEFGELIKTPLGLTLLASLDPHQVEKFGSKRERESDTGTLWDAYLKLMVARSGKRRLPTSPDRLLRVLGELSRAMKRQRISLFHLDDLQPSVLAEGWLQTLYFLSTRIAGGVVWGAGTVLAIGQSPVDNLGLHADLGFGVTLGLAAALGCGLTHGIWMAMRSRSQQQGIVRAHWVRVLVLSLLGGLVTSALVCRRGAGAGILGFEVVPIRTVAGSTPTFARPTPSPSRYAMSPGHGLMRSPLRPSSRRSGWP
jgi:energy-coupling factor transporter ATP-binding protein EcfA2